jgi:hypothetical protein
VKSAACELNQFFDTLHHLIIVETLLSRQVLEVGKQVIVTLSEIEALRSTVNQLPDEMLRQCSIASSFMQTLIAMEERYTGCHHSTF